ncbi:hypothetical protein C0971_15800 [Bacillus methanolicus]|nr:hypothetical protein C0971_15800 [Bacillus methanolicus]
MFHLIILSKLSINDIQKYLKCLDGLTKYNFLVKKRQLPRPTICIEASPTTILNACSDSDRQCFF